jgi:transposase
VSSESAWIAVQTSDVADHSRQVKRTDRKDTECAPLAQEGLSRKLYPSDLTDEQWATVEPLVPPAKQSPRGGRPREGDMREVLHTMFSLNRSGCPWDMLPHDVLPKSTVYDFFAPWRATIYRTKWSMDCANERIWKRGASPICLKLSRLVHQRGLALGTTFPGRSAFCQPLLASFPFPFCLHSSIALSHWLS